MNEPMNINWYPGHMKKTKELVQANMKLVDAVVEVVDSRIAFSSKNPDIDVLAKGKARVIILNKEDLADAKITNKWINYYNNKGYTAISMNSISGLNLDKLHAAINKTYEPVKEKLEKRGMIARAPRIMIVGVPNSGKSSLINKLSGKKSAQTGDRPGVTRGKQWVRLRGNLEMLDTPGILWPKFEDDRVSLMLAFTGAIKDDILNLEDICFELIKYLQNHYFEVLAKRYDLTCNQECETIEIMDEIASNRRFFFKGKEIDYLRTSKAVLNDFRAGNLGRISLEDPEELNLI